MLVRVCEVRFFVREATTRLPFRFGATTMTWAPLLLCQAVIETSEAGRTTGWSSDLLPPKWFDKRPGRAHREDIVDLIASARRAAALASDPALPPLTAFDLWWGVYGQCVLRTDLDPALRLAAGFGVALVERAVIDAVCRTAGMPFFKALRGHEILGFHPAAVHSELAAWDPRRSLPEQPLERIEVRHTVGLADPLEPDGAQAGAPALSEIIPRTGIRRFKVKLSGDLESDRERLSAFSRVAGAWASSDWRLTMDANENFADLGNLVRLLELVALTDAGRDLLSRLDYIEQPLPRGATFKRSAAKEMDRVTPFAPCIIDEADGDTKAFPEAMACGYRGVSVKNCKGVFRALLNLGLCATRSTPRQKHFLAAEDLTCLPIVSLQQDLCTVAALGIKHSERNGHHYFAGLDHLPKAEALEALHAHPQLYTLADRRVSVRIQDGDIDVRSLNGPGFGAATIPHVESWIPLEDWRFPEGR